MKKKKLETQSVMIKPEAWLKISLKFVCQKTRKKNGKSVGRLKDSEEKKWFKKDQVVQLTVFHIRVW